MLIIIKFAPTHDSRIFRGGFKGMEFNVGIGGRVPSELAPYVAIGHLLFDSVGLSRLFAPHAENLRNIPNYSNVVGELQISDIV
jgi:hypothetical protein